MKLKRLLCLALAALLLLSLAGCSLLYQAEYVGNRSETDYVFNTVGESESAPADTQKTEPQDTQPEDTQPIITQAVTEGEALLPEDGVYDDAEHVALYIHQYGHLPNNYITKKEAEALGWSGGSLEPYAPGKCIGGSRFGNYEGLLPEAKGRTYTECDIDTLGAKSRGAKRIVFSNDGLIYYTDDHYESFELLYGGE